MKVKTNIMLDEKVKKTVQKHLAISGMSMSSFINTILTEFANEIEGQPININKPVKDLTLGEFGELVSYWTKKASE